MKRSHDDLSLDFDFDLGFDLDFSRKGVEFQLNSDLDFPNKVGVDSDTKMTGSSWQKAKDDSLFLNAF